MTLTLLITDHFDQTGIARMMQGLGRKYVQYVNHTYGRTGTLWESRYKSTLVDTEAYLLTVYRYIELNPARGGNRGRFIFPLAFGVQP